MRRWIPLTLKIIAALILVIILVWIGGAIYITRNKETVLKSILGQLNKNINGTLTAASMDPALLKGFPGISVTLNQVLVRDSLWKYHKHDLLRAEQINVSLNVFSLVAGNTRINRIAIENASVCLFTDSVGYSNVSMFKTDDGKTSTGKKAPAIEVKNIDFKNVRFIIDNQQHFKRFDFAVGELRGRIKYPGSGFAGSIKLNTLVKSFSFNTRRGSFLKDRVLKGTLVFHYDKAAKAIVIEPNKLDIGEDTFNIGAKIYFDRSAFAIDIAADQIMFHNIASLLAPNISSKLLRFNISKPITVKGTIREDGTGKYADPIVNVAIGVKDSEVKIPSGGLEHADFEGSFTNQVLKGKPIGDENSAVVFRNLTADYYNAPITIDRFTINNLSRPIASGRVKAKFPLENLNRSIGGTILKFASGRADVDLFCQADIENFSFTKPALNGNIRISGADITYLPRNMRLVNSALLLNFSKTDLTLKNSHFQLGKSILNMDCTVKNFLNFYYTAPEKILINLNMSSPQLSLDQLIPFLTTRQVVKKKAGIKEFTDQLAVIFEAAKMNLKLKVSKTSYNKFIASSLAADIDLISNAVFVKSLTVNHAGGKLSLSGNIRQTGARNKFALKSTISRVNVREFFNAFDNFGQKAITQQNLRGYLSSVVNVTGSLTDKGGIVPRSFNGTVAFNLKDAALINFDPMLKAGKFAFANRDFADIRMPNLDGILNIQGEKIIINPMQINSSVLNMDVKGIYSLGAGTNIAMDIPLRNPKNDGELKKDQKKDARMRGIVLHLKAIDGDDGKVKIRWNKDHD